MSIKGIIGQVLAPEQADNINGLSAQRTFPAAQLRAMGQGLIEKNGRGVTEKYTTAADVRASAEIVVRRIIPHKLNPRQLGRGRNGGNYTGAGNFSESENVSIKVLEVIDDQIFIANVAKDMIPTDIVASELANYTISTDNVINGATFAAKFYGSFGDSEVAEKDVNKVLVDLSGDNLAQKFIEANGKLMAGDPAHGFFTFPQNGRVVAIQSDHYALLWSKGVLVLNNGIVSDAGQRMLAKGGISPDTTETVVENGYIGMVNGVPCHVYTPYIVALAEEYLGLLPGDLAPSKYLGYVSSDVATARGVSMQDSYKVVDEINGQGIRIQPLIKFGVKTWFQKGNVHLVTDAFVNPYALVRTNLTKWNTKKFDLIGWGSRYVPQIAISAVSTAGFTATATAKDDFGQEHVDENLYYICAKTPYTNVGDFAKAYATESKKGTFRKGVPVGSLSASSKDYISVIAIGDDGTFNIEVAQIG